MFAPSRRTLLVSGLLATASIVAACRRRVPPTGVPHRIVTLGPNATEILFALGVGDHVVGVSRYDDYPPAVASLPRVGGLLDPSFEAIVALRPDAVLGSRGPMNRAVLARLESLGVRTLFPQVETLADIRAAITSVAAFVGVPERGRAVVADLDEAIARQRERSRTVDRPGVLAVFGQRPIVVAGPHSFADELITLGGGRNVVRDGPTWPMVSIETVVSLAPDIVLDLGQMEAGPSLADGWSERVAIPAVRNRRVVRINDPVVLRPGPRVAIAAQRYFDAIHPAR